MYALNHTPAAEPAIQACRWLVTSSIANEDKMNTDLQRGYGLPQSRLSAAMAAGGWLDEEERKDKKSEKKPDISKDDEGEGESSPSSRAVADVGEGITDRTDRSA